MIINREIFFTHIKEAERYVKRAEDHLSRSEIMSTEKFKNHYYELCRFYIEHAKAQLVMAKLYVTVDDKPLQFKGFENVF